MIETINKKDNIIHVVFSSREQLCKAFLMVQEYYESPKFKGCKFKLEEFKEWYTEQKGSWSYYSDWNGFNIPGKVLMEYLARFSCDMNHHSEEEQVLMKALAEMEIDEAFYLIGTHIEGGEKQSIDHELAHAFYYLDSKYKDLVNYILSGLDIDTYFPIYKALKDLGYHPSVIKDEIHAYITDGGYTDFIPGRDLSDSDKLLFEYIEKIYQVKRRTYDLQ